MAEPDIDLRGTQGAVVLPGGTVVQNYERDERMNPQQPGDINSRMYDQGRELAEIKARLIALEVMMNQVMTMLQRPAVAITSMQLFISVGLAVLIVALVLGINYAGR